MDLSEQARILRSRWLIIAVVVAVGLVALAVFGRGPAAKYKATAVLVFQETGNPPRDAYIQDLTAAAALARKPLVSIAAAAHLNATNTPADLATKIVARAHRELSKDDVDYIEATAGELYRKLAKKAVNDWTKIED